MSAEIEFWFWIVVLLATSESIRLEKENYHDTIGKDGKRNE